MEFYTFYISYLNLVLRFLESIWGKNEYFSDYYVNLKLFRNIIIIFFIDMIKFFYLGCNIKVIFLLCDENSNIFILNILIILGCF